MTLSGLALDLQRGKQWVCQQTQATVKHTYQLEVVVTCSVLWWSSTSIPSVTSTPWWCFHSGMQLCSSLLPSVLLDFYYNPHPTPITSPLSTTNNGATLRNLLYILQLYLFIYTSVNYQCCPRHDFRLNTSCSTPIRIFVVRQMVQAELTWQLTDGLTHIFFFPRHSAENVANVCWLRLSAPSLCLE